MTLLDRSRATEEKIRTQNLRTAGILIEVIAGTGKPRGGTAFLQSAAPKAVIIHLSGKLPKSIKRYSSGNTPKGVQANHHPRQRPLNPDSKRGQATFGVGQSRNGLT